MREGKRKGDSGQCSKETVTEEEDITKDVNQPTTKSQLTLLIGIFPSPLPIYERLPTLGKAAFCS